MKRPLLGLAFLIGVVALAASIPGREIPAARQASLYQNLFVASSIAFAVIGAWIAIVFPNALSAALGRDVEQGKGQRRRVQRLLTALLVSTVVVIAVLVYGIAAEVLRTIPWALERVSVFRSASFSLLVFLSGLQAISILLAVGPAIDAESQIDTDLHRSSSIADMKRRSHRR